MRYDGAVRRFFQVWCRRRRGGQRLATSERGVQPPDLHGALRGSGAAAAREYRDGEAVVPRPRPPVAPRQASAQVTRPPGSSLEALQSDPRSVRGPERRCGQTRIRRRAAAPGGAASDARPRAGRWAQRRRFGVWSCRRQRRECRPVSRRPPNAGDATRLRPGAGRLLPFRRRGDRRQGEPWQQQQRRQQCWELRLRGALGVAAGARQPRGIPAWRYRGADIQAPYAWQPRPWLAHA
mmetsp:Transcript_111820/g.315871  ORF Transcript_111820/g.315871 Transcript_111820/m.315871 type:complete len:237 (+) Transcript_111820:1072-1782(+)